MLPTEVVVAEVKVNGSPEIISALAKSVGQSRETAHVHPHRQVLPLNVRRGDEAFFRRTNDDVLRGRSNFRWAVPTGPAGSTSYDFTIVA